MRVPNRNMDPGTTWVIHAKSSPPMDCGANWMALAPSSMRAASSSRAVSGSALTTGGTNVFDLDVDPVRGRHLLDDFIQQCPGIIPGCGV